MPNSSSAAAAAFLAGGFDGTSMESVAEEAGVTRLIVYRHFESKEALYRAVLDSVVEPLRLEFVPDQPAGIGALLLRVARHNPDGFRLLWRHARHEPTFAKEAEAFRQIAAGFADNHIRVLCHRPHTACLGGSDDRRIPLRRHLRVARQRRLDARRRVRWPTPSRGAGARGHVEHGRLTAWSGRRRAARLEPLEQ